MREALAALESARLGEAAERIRGNERLMESSLALSLLGQILECEGREAEALEVYFSLHARVVLGPDDWIHGLIRENGFSPSLPAIVPRSDAAFVGPRLVALAAQGGEKEWARAVAAIPALRETDPADWREAIAAFSPGDPARLVPYGPVASVEDWFEFLKWQPSNEVVVRHLIDIHPAIAWDEFAAYLLEHDAEMSLNTEARLRSKVLRESDRISERYEALADWFLARSDAELHSLTGEVVRDLVASFGFAGSDSKNRAFVALRRVIDRLLQAKTDPDYPADLLMFRAHRALEITSEMDAALEDANRAAALWEARSETIRKETGLPPSSFRHRPLGKGFYHWKPGLTEMETVPPGSAGFLEEPIDQAWADRLQSPVFRAMVGEDTELRWQRLGVELAAARGKGKPAVVRDLRRLLWAFAPHEGDGLNVARRDCEMAAKETSDPYFAFEAEIWRSRLEGRADVGTWGERRVKESERLQTLAKTLLPSDQETRDRTKHLIHSVLNTFYVREEMREREISEPLREWLPLVKREAWLERGKEGREEGMSDLVAQLRHFDALGDGEGGRRIARLLHERFPRRGEWAAELALRMSDDGEAFRLLDEAMSSGEAGMRRILLATSPFRLRENSWSAEARDAVARRIARWEKSRRPSGDRRWLREAIPMLVDFSPGHEAWEMLFDGAGSAEGAFDRMREQGGTAQLAEAKRLELARRVLLSGAYARDESPWMDRERYFGKRVLPRPHNLRGTAKALMELATASERLGHAAVFPDGFLAELAEVDPVTAEWLKRTLAGDAPPPRFASDAEWYGRGQGPDRRGLGRQTMPPPPERSVLKFAVPWHERARFEAGHLLARARGR